MSAMWRRGVRGSIPRLDQLKARVLGPSPISRAEQRFGLAPGVPDRSANRIGTSRRDMSSLRGPSRDGGGPLELLHHQGNAPLRLPLAVRARYLPEQLERPADPSIQHGRQLLALAERPRQGQSAIRPWIDALLMPARAGDCSA